MEARVDIRKLQQLNDRINQVLDALSQVRLSVYGLSHTGAQVQNPYGVQNPWAAQQGAQAGISPYATQINPLAGQIGLQHSPFNPQVGFGAQTGFAQQIGVPQVDPRLMALQSPFGAAGLGHSSPVGVEWTDQAYMDARASDPFRLARTFPYAFSGASPLSTGLR